MFRYDGPSVSTRQNDSAAPYDLPYIHGPIMIAQLARKSTEAIDHLIAQKHHSLALSMDAVHNNWTTAWT